MQEKEKEYALRINTESFGREHFFREIGLQYYFNFMDNVPNENKDKKEKQQKFVRIVAKLMLQGYAIELMDGDNLFIWTRWVEAVLDSLEDEIKAIIEEEDPNAKNETPKGVSISIMGLQSSGKSTMLNCMYNSKFAVAAGRCTKGIYMLPVMLD